MSLSLNNHLSKPNNRLIQISPAIIFFAFSAQKTHVKSQNHLTIDQSARSAWRISYVQTAILDIEIEKQAAPETLRG
jgi:hypothetical protein